MTANQTTITPEAATHQAPEDEISCKISLHQEVKAAIAISNKKQLELAENLGQAKLEYSRAEQCVASAKARKSAAHSIEEMSASTRELEKAKSRYDDAEALIRNIDDTLKDLPGKVQELRWKESQARQAIYAEKSKQILLQLKASEEFETVRTLLEKAYSAAVRLGGVYGNFSWFLGSVFSDCGGTMLSENKIDEHATEVIAELGLD